MTDCKLCFVLIRGLLREARHWGTLPELLQKQYPNALILTPDIPGNGKLNHLTSPDTIEGMTDALRAQVTKEYALQLIAISMGGMIAIDWMSRYSAEVNSAVLINTSLSNFSPFYQRLRWQNYPRIIRSLFTPKRNQEQLILELTSNKHVHDIAIISKWQQWQQENPVSTLSAKNQLIAAATFSISSVPVQPLLIISSLTDRLVDYRCSLKLQHSWHKDYKQHNSAGHDLSLDDPEWLMTEISLWFNQH